MKFLFSWVRLEGESWVAGLLTLLYEMSNRLVPFLEQRQRSLLYFLFFFPSAYFSGLLCEYKHCLLKPNNNLIKHLLDCLLYRVVQLHVACTDSNSHIIGYSIQVMRQGVSIKCMHLSWLFLAMVMYYTFDEEKDWFCEYWEVGRYTPPFTFTFTFTCPLY